jgi:hypothetical protein
VSINLSIRQHHHEQPLRHLAITGLVSTGGIANNTFVNVDVRAQQ